VRIGIAGYMGAGKSTCAHKFHYPDTLIIDADTEAKLLMQSNPKLQLDLKDAFGESVIDGKNVCFSELGRKAFSSASTLLTLNRIIHPPLVKHLQSRVRNDENTNCILDAALIPMLNIESWLDLCIWVDSSFEVRLKRLIAKRADIEKDELRRRMRLQEEVMPVPQSGRWVRLPDSECEQYIKNQLEAKNSDAKNTGR